MTGETRTEQSSSSGGEYWAHVWAWRNIIIVVLTPALLLPLCLCFEDDPELRVSQSIIS